MFYKYEIRNNGIEDILYLYLTMSYEFSKEIGISSDDKELSRRTKNFINSNRINYKGNKVFLVIDGIVVKSLDISKNSDDIEILKSDLYYSNDHFFVNVQLDNGTFTEITLRDYLLGVLACNVSNSLEKEALKALCVLYRSLVFKEMNEKNCISSINKFAIYKPISYYKLSWINDYQDIIKKFNEAINETDCLFATFQDHYILPFIHYSNNGRTLESKNYKFLSSVSSLWDLASPHYISIVDLNYFDISRLLNININSNSDIIILDIDQNNLVKRIKIDNTIFNIDTLVDKLNLNSKDINIILNRDYIRFISKGHGEFFGLSIFGANELAKNGCDYANIIRYYYPKITINKYIKELS